MILRPFRTLPNRAPLSPSEIYYRLGNRQLSEMRYRRLRRRRGRSGAFAWFTSLEKFAICRERCPRYPSLALIYGPPLRRDRRDAALLLSALLRLLGPGRRASEQLHPFLGLLIQLALNQDRTHVALVLLIQSDPHLRNKVCNFPATFPIVIIAATLIKAITAIPKLLPCKCLQMLRYLFTQNRCTKVIRIHKAFSAL